MDYSKNGYLSGSTLKIIALISMLIDHIAAYLINDSSIMLYHTMREIGRLAFPIFCFLLVEGYFKTTNIKKYMLRLFILAIISEVPFDLPRTGSFGLSFDHQNVFFTLLFGLIVIYIIDNNKEKKWLQCIAIWVVAFLAYLLRFDYNAFGIIQILMFYYFKNITTYRIAGIIMLNLMMRQPAGACALFFTEFYNGKRGLKLKYIFYAFYPLHLLILYLIKLLFL